LIKRHENKFAFGKIRGRRIARRRNETQTLAIRK